MKKLIYILILAVFLTACKKIYVYLPANPQADNSTPAGNNSSTDSNTSNLNAIGFDIKDQVVKISVNHGTLNMSYNENINLLIKADSLKNTWAVIFSEDFSKAKLNNFDFTTLTRAGVTALNYADDNLNNVTLSARRDTLINNVATTRISFSRVFTFTGNYATNADALAEYNLLLTTKDTVGFSTFITSAKGTSSAYTSRNNLIYVAN